MADSSRFRMSHCGSLHFLLSDSSPEGLALAEIRAVIMGPCKAEEECAAVKDSRLQPVASKHLNVPLSNEIIKVWIPMGCFQFLKMCMFMLHNNSIHLRDLAHTQSHLQHFTSVYLPSPPLLLSCLLPSPSASHKHL